MSREVLDWVEYFKLIGVRDWNVGGAMHAEDSTGSGISQDTPVVETSAKSTASTSVKSSSSTAKSSAASAAEEATSKTTTATDAKSTKTLSEIRAELGDCQRCRLHEGRTHLVFGVGNPSADLMFVGEGPGADEDIQGEPFVGRAGKKLNEMISAIGLERELVYIANVVKCRPPNNRDPKPDEIATCSPFLDAQIEAINPKVIVTLGSPATKLLLQTTTGITKLRGQWHKRGERWVRPTFHPAYLLRAYTKENRAMVWDDLKAAKARLEGKES